MRKQQHRDLTTRSRQSVWIILSLLLSVSVSASRANAQAAPPTALSRTPSSLLQIEGGSPYYSPYAFVVDKKARTLTVWHHDGTTLKAVATYPADMGRSTGDKKTRGDYKTPNGIYFLERRMAGPTLDFNLYGQLAFATNYPNYFDRMDGKDGGGIWLHAVPDKVTLSRGSRGCVVVRNNIIPILGEYVQLGKTPIIIQDEVELLDGNSSQGRTGEILKAIDSWRTAWEKKDIEGYIAFYGSKFRGQKMDRTQWKAFKQHLNESYKTFAVKLSHPVIYTYRDQAVVRFLQQYSSDEHTDFGEKTLYLMNEGDGFKIVGEDWRADDSKVAMDEFNNSQIARTAAASAPTAASTASTSSSSSAPETAHN